MSDASGLKCPNCGSHRLQVKDSRPKADTIRRIRRCYDCEAKFTTAEVIRETTEREA